MKKKQKQEILIIKLLYNFQRNKKFASQKEKYGDHREEEKKKQQKKRMKIDNINEKKHLTNKKKHLKRDFFLFVLNNLEGVKSYV